MRYGHFIYECLITTFIGVYEDKYVGSRRNINLGRIYLLDFVKCTALIKSVNIYDS